jgi:N-acetyl-gamma-glutamyl-phosphate reductase / acetylglutamate kinase
VEEAVRYFEKEDLITRGYLPVTPGGAAKTGEKPAGTRGYRTWSTGLKTSAATQFGRGLGKIRGYATTISSSSVGAEVYPVTTPGEKSLGLIGARGYTGQALVKLLNGHPYLNLAKVSSRALVGRVLEGYGKITGSLK